MSLILFLGRIMPKLHLYLIDIQSMIPNSKTMLEDHYSVQILTQENIFCFLFMLKIEFWTYA